MSPTPLESDLNSRNLVLSRIDGITKLHGAEPVLMTRESLDIDPAAIEANREAWIAAWTDVMLR